MTIRRGLTFIDNSTADTATYTAYKKRTGSVLQRPQSPGCLTTFTPHLVFKMTLALEPQSTTPKIPGLGLFDNLQTTPHI